MPFLEVKKTHAHLFTWRIQLCCYYSFPETLTKISLTGLLQRHIYIYIFFSLFDTQPTASFFNLSRHINIRPELAMENIPGNY